jgi:hypothetical protein
LISVCEHAPPLHSKGLAQSAFVVQLARQPVALQTKRPQLVAADVPQVPVPLQVRAGVKVLIEHVAAAQTAPAPYRRQAPEPSQLPSVPHVATPWSAHWFSGSWPAGTTLHVPRLPA